MSKADFTIQTASGEGAPVVSLRGDWTAVGLRDAGERLKSAVKGQTNLRIDSSELKGFDTAGAYAVRAAVGDTGDGDLFSGQDNHQRVYALVCDLQPKIAEAQHKAARKAFSPIINTLAAIGRSTAEILADIRNLNAFVGQLVVVCFLSCVNPRRIRWTPLVAQMQRAGLGALAVVCVTNFFVGAVVAFLGILQLQQFGAAVFAVELIGISVLREFGPVIAAVLMAGRSASSFTAEIGAMKMNQEIDAMRVMGINPFDALIFPRLAALVLTLPLVSFAGSMAGLFGGLVVVWGTLGYGPNFFSIRMTEYVPFVNYFVGMIKTPFFAAAITIIGCRLGMIVTSDVISLGKQVTKAVVQAIFTIILIDAAFAMMFNGFNF
ncbi:ABC transporter permease [Asticcacaulis sp. BYS171W]|uniref:ABC transporter permease n=1 Tax=Asticcacaulis aquaticus TaxID=2984212 RepID=A0ABT5HU97_9CAUL|nr:ABC transporter permease [Asticcacaulis aquaticus]MDC7683420.1 ABC transporter permease [Asticcacaulis aquaticus]